jgi:hypothetical protein
MLLTYEIAHDWMHLMRSEYLEVPGLALTSRQAQRLWGLDRESCDRLLDAMVADSFLRKTERDTYVRVDVDR